MTARPAHGSKTMPWKSSGRPPREDREFTEVVVSLPPMIAACWFDPGRETIVALEGGRSCRRVPGRHGPHPDGRHQRVPPAQ
jgi:hypothetical protein